MKFIFSLILILSFCNLSAQVLPTPTGYAKNDNGDLTIGMRFEPTQQSVIYGLRYYRSEAFIGSTTGALWDKYGKKLAEINFPDGSGWISASFNSPQLVDSGTQYIVTYSNENGYYISEENYFPKSFELYNAITSNYIAFRNTFPTFSYNQSNYFIEPVIEKFIKKDTIYLIRDTCSIDYTKINDLTFVLVLPDEGGHVRLPDSTTAYQAVYGAIPPHIRLKDSIGGIMYRFQRSYTISGVSTPIRFTMYKTGAWIRERKDNAGIWQIYPYAPY